MNNQTKCLVYRQDNYYGIHTIKDKSRFISELVNRALSSKNNYCIIHDRHGISGSAILYLNRRKQHVSQP